MYWNGEENMQSTDLTLIDGVLGKYADVPGSLITVLQKTQDIYWRGERTAALLRRELRLLGLVGQPAVGGVRTGRLRAAHNLLHTRHEGEARLTGRRAAHTNSNNDQNRPL